MKIKSITDIITNSSSEVFIVKTSDLEEAKKEIYDKSWRKKLFCYDELENIFDLFKSIKTLDDISREDLIDFSEYYENIEELDSLVTPFKLSFREIKILKDLNFTDEEIKDYEDKKNEKRIKERDSKKELKKILGMSIARAYDHNWIGLGSLLLEWLKEHNKDFYHDIT